jgi:hypothetical protein
VVVGEPELLELSSPLPLVLCGPASPLSTVWPGVVDDGTLVLPSLLDPAPSVPPLGDGSI